MPTKRAYSYHSARTGRNTCPLVCLGTVPQDGASDKKLPNEMMDTVPKHVDDLQAPAKNLFCLAAPDAWRCVRNAPEPGLACHSQAQREAHLPRCR